MPFTRVRVLPPLALVTLLLLSLTTPEPVSAQAAIRGIARDSVAGVPLGAVLVRALRDGRHHGTALSSERGAFELVGLAAGTYELDVTRLGYAPARYTVVASARPDTVWLELVPAAVSLDPLVVSATLSDQTRLTAPASVTVIPRLVIRETTALTALDYIRDVPGIDFASKGLMTNTFSTRGPRDVTAASLLVLADYRYAAVPALGFNVGLLIPNTSDDIQRIEVVRGPAAVAYGPNSRRGIIHIVKRSPLAEQGTEASLAGGGRSYVDASFRHAARLGPSAAFKVSARYAGGDEWEYVDSAEVALRAAAIAAGADPDTLLLGLREDRVEHLQGEARLDWEFAPGSVLATTAGITQATGIETSPEAGAAQAVDWRYGYLQARLDHGRLFANLMYNTSDAGDTYNLRSGVRFIDDSRLLAGQLQHGTIVGATDLLYGLDVRWTMPRTGGTLHGRFEEDDDLVETGLYAFSTTALSERLDVVAALRADHHNRLDEPWFLSPRAGLVLETGRSHATRFTVSRSFAQPSTRDLFTDLFLGPLGPLPFGLRLASSGGRGFSFSRDCDGLCMRVPAAFLPGSAGEELPLDATLAWPAIVGFMQQQGLDLSGIPAPTAPAVQTRLGVLNAATGAFDPISPGDVVDSPPVQRVTETSWEIGHKGVFAERLFVGLDLYVSRVRNLYATTSSVGTPSVFFDAASLTTHLAQFMPPDVAAQVAAGIATVPVGTVGPREVPGVDLLVLSPARQLGSYTHVGADLALSWEASSRLTLGGSYSWIRSDSVGLGERAGFLLMQAPEHKATASADYRDPVRAITVGARGRALLSGFWVRAPAYVGRVEPHTTIDLRGSWSLPLDRRLRLSLDVFNAFGGRRTEFIGAPAIGRLVVARLHAAI